MRYRIFWASRLSSARLASISSAITPLTKPGQPASPQLSQAPRGEVVSKRRSEGIPEVPCAFPSLACPLAREPSRVPAPEVSLVPCPFVPTYSQHQFFVELLLKTDLRRSILAKHIRSPHVPVNHGSATVSRGPHDYAVRNACPSCLSDQTRAQRMARIVRGMLPTALACRLTMLEAAEIYFLMLDRIWGSTDIEGKIAVQNAVFPSHIVVAPAGFRTAPNDSLMRELQVGTDCDATLASPGGFEPPLPP